jgi:hypothetical protein
MYQTMYDNFIAVGRGYVYKTIYHLNNCVQLLFVSSTFLSVPDWQINVPVHMKLEKHTCIRYTTHVKLNNRSQQTEDIHITTDKKYSESNTYSEYL